MKAAMLVESLTGNTWKAAEAIADDAKSTEQQAAADNLRLEREAAIADHKAAQLRAETQN